MINKKNKCCTSSLCPNDKVSNSISSDLAKSRFHLLKYCYLNLSTNFFDSKTKNDDKNSNPEGKYDIFFLI